MKLNVINSLITGVALLISSFANSTIITTGSLSHDTATSIVVDSMGLEWHTLDYNNIMIGDGSISTLINSRLAFGGDLYGWEIAKQADYFQMLTNAGATNISNDQRDPLTSEFKNFAFSGLDYAAYFEMFKLGNSYTNNNNSYDFYIVNQTNENVLDEDNLRWTYATQTSLKDFTTKGADFFNKSESQRMSIMLSRPGDLVSVPEPTTLALFSLAMIGLASRRVKK